MKKAIKHNHYRVLKPCKDCPLVDNGKKMHLVEGRVDDIKASLLQGEHFVCHKTAYDEPFVSRKERYMCAGAYEFLKSKFKMTPIMQLALITNSDDDLRKWFDDNHNKIQKVGDFNV